MPELPDDDAAVRAAVDAHLARHVAALRDELAAHLPDVEPLLDELRTAVHGGKRVRAALCWWSYRAHGGGDGLEADAALAVGAALELFQAAALVHDDLMDGSDTRRGRPAAHRAFEALHREHDWQGPAGGFGLAGAVLLGDLALIASERQVGVAVLPLPRATAVEVRAVFDAMRTEVTVGQYLDVLAQHLPWGADPADDERRARHVLRAKSARYSVEHPLTLGAVLAGADAAARSRCATVGLPLGEAFQLRDDLLGVFGDPDVTGKPAGDDLREGKRTVLVARAVGALPEVDRQRVRSGLGRRGLDDDAVGDLRDLVGASGAVEQVEDLIAALATPALATLEAAPLHEPGRTALLRLARRLVDRDA